MKRRAADIAIDTLVEMGVTDCFAVVGGGAMHLDNALALNDSIRVTFNHHEQACAMAAEAYARLSGRIALACVTSGPGASNAITGVVGAWQDSYPMIVLSGQVRYATMVRSTDLNLRYRGVQELDIVPMVESITKYAVIVTDPKAIRKEIRKAVSIAMSGRRGPVWVDVPLDVQSAIVDVDDLYDDEPVANDLPRLDSESADEIRNYLCNARRPCILGGTGIVSSGNRERFLEFANRVGVPVVAGGWCADLMGTDSDIYFGLSGDIGPRAGNFIVQTADVLLVLGNSLSFRQTGFLQSAFAPEAKILYVDVDADEAKKPGLRITRFYHSDLGAFFDAMEPIAYKWRNPAWLDFCKKVKAEYTPYESIQGGVDPLSRVDSYYFWSIADKVFCDRQILAMGNSRVNAAKLQIGVKTQNQRVLTNYLCGSMGYDLPAAIGAARASDDGVICVTGDGSVMMNLQELQTIHHNNLPIKIIVFCNDGYEAIRQTNKNFFHGVYFGCSPDSGISFPDLEGLANAFGFAYIKCSCNSEIENRLNAFLESDEQVIMEVLQRLDNPVVPKVMSRVNPDGSFQTPALQDMAPFLPVDELEGIMTEGKSA